MKRRTLKFFCYLSVLFSALCLMAISCEPGCHDKFYLKNNLSTPITYSRINTTSGSQRNELTIQPGESKLVYEYIGRRSEFENIEAFPYCYELELAAANEHHSVTFSDGIVWQWNWSNQINMGKHPSLTKCWNILHFTQTKHRSAYEVEYVVDSVDYQNVIQTNILD